MIGEKLIKAICGENWMDIIDERESGYAIAMMYIFIFDKYASEADVTHFSRVLKVPLTELIPVYKRMFNYGLFSKVYGARKDKDLLYQSDSARSSMTAWCYVAGIGAGLV